VLWLWLCVPSMILGRAIATVPALHMTHREHRLGMAEQEAQRAGTAAVTPQVQELRPLDNVGQFGWTVCDQCKAVVVDAAEHRGAAYVSSTEFSVA